MAAETAETAAVTVETTAETAETAARETAAATVTPDGKGELNNADAQESKTQKSAEGPHER